jgi:hypothetical protein
MDGGHTDAKVYSLLLLMYLGYKSLFALLLSFKVLTLSFNQ